jgi:hypothetical protein
MSDKKKSRRIWLYVVAVALALILAGGLAFWLTLPAVEWLKKEDPKETAMMRFRGEQARQKAGRRAASRGACRCRASRPT